MLDGEWRGEENLTTGLYMHITVSRSVLRLVGYVNPK